MSGDLSLFGDDEPAAPDPSSRAEAAVADWQVDLLRKALDARGLTTQVERKQAIETAAERSVESLRALTHSEALNILSRLGPAPPTQMRSTSAWDDRDEDTWIDRL